MSEANEWLVVGLGNTGNAYRDTRHNAGFWFVDRLARRAGGCFICPSDDKEAIQGQLLRLYGAWRDGRELDGPERNRVRFYDRGFQARRMLRFLRSVHEDRARDLR